MKEPSGSWRFAVTRDERGNPRTLHLADEEFELHLAPVTVERRDDEDLRLTDARVAREFAVLLRGESLFVLRLDDIDSRRILGEANACYAYDARLPGYAATFAGDPLPAPNPPVTYECANGDVVIQPASNPSRRCPVCGELLSPA